MKMLSYFMKTRVRSDSATFVADNPNLTGHIPALDGVRGLAILMVLLGHFTRVQPQNQFELIFTSILGFGALGVDLFFVLSGFLITGILCDSRESSHYFRNFYMRRTLRIFPLYYGTLLFLLVIVPHFIYVPGLEKTIQNQAWLWGYSSNIYLAMRGKFEALPYLNHFWSLSIEEHFYLLWPLVVYFNNGRRLKLIALFVVSGALLLRIAMVAAGVNHIAVYTLTPARMDALALGGILAVVARDDGGMIRLKQIAPSVAAVGLTLIIVTFLTQKLIPETRPYLSEVRGLLFPVWFCALLIIAMTGPLAIQRFFCNNVMKFFGKYSYGLYVLHFIFGYAFIRFGLVNYIARWVVGSHTLAIFIQAILGIAFSILLSVTSYNLFEKHFLKLKAYF